MTLEEDTAQTIAFGREIASRLVDQARKLDAPLSGPPSGIVAAGILFAIAHAVDTVCDVATDALADEQRR